jgi:ParB-like chromosome segregation protein Spo0J
MEVVTTITPGTPDTLVRESFQERPKLKVDDGFRGMIPPLSQEEFKQLERNIIEYGCTDPLIIWDGHDIILDGHNRYRICSDLGIDFETRSIKLETREDAEIWIINRQMGRRSLTESQKSYLRGLRYNIEKKAAHRPEKGGQSDHLKTSEQIAEELKVSPRTVRRDAEYAAAIDSLRDDAEPDFVAGILREEIKLNKGDVKKLAGKPVQEKKHLINVIQNGAKNLIQAEAAIRKRNASESGYFEQAGSDIEFAAWSWNPRNLDAPKNTQSPANGCEVKDRVVWIDADIFGDGFHDDETVEILRVIRESPQWIFMVHTDLPEKFKLSDWPANACVGCIVDSQEKARQFPGIFKKIEGPTRFVICDLHNESIAFDSLSGFNWIIIRNMSKIQPPWQRVESVLEQSLSDSLWIHLMPNITVRPREYPRLQDQTHQEVFTHEVVKVTA